MVRRSLGDAAMSAEMNKFYYGLPDMIQLYFMLLYLNLDFHRHSLENSWAAVHTSLEQITFACARLECQISDANFLDRSPRRILGGAI